jgi:hypothetical protein
MKKYLPFSLLLCLTLNTGLARAAKKGVSSATAPSAPGELKTLFVGPWLLSLSWRDNSSDETSFVIEQSLSSNFATIQSTYLVPGNSTRFVIKDLTPDMTYYFRIRSENATGISEPSPVLTVTTGKDGLFPLSVTDGMLHNRIGEPFLIIGDSPWSLIVGPDMDGAEKYLDNRKAKGVNSLLINLVEAYFNGPQDAYGNQPFLTPGDFTTPNPAYFDNVDYVIGKALEKGIEVFLYPAYLGYDDGYDHKEGWYNAINDNGPDKMYWYGKYIGQRYKDYRNIVWVMGGDCAPGNDMDEIRALVKGIEETAGSQIFSVHNGRFHSGITEYPDEKWVDLNTTYADKYTTASQLMEDNNRRFPFCYIEGTYENDNISDVNLRSQMYLPILMGASGFFFGNASLFEFNEGWEDSTVIESQGSRDLQRFTELFKNRVWYHLHPDINHSLLTEGAGDIQGEKYAAAALAEDSSSAIIYVPESRKLTVNLNKISGSKTHVWWFKPSNGNIIDGSIINDLSSFNLYPPSESDWVLFLEDASRGISEPRTEDRMPENPERGNNPGVVKNSDLDTTASLTTGFIYPNPAHDEFQITEKHSDNAQITIFDLYGKTMLYTKVVNNTVRISSLPEGWYVVQLFDYDRILMTKLLKE